MTKDQRDIRDAMSSAWREILALDGELCDADDFFRLGGASLAVVQLVHMLKEKYAVDLTIRDVFEDGGFESLIRRAEYVGDDD